MDKEYTVVSDERYDEGKIKRKGPRGRRTDSDRSKTLEVEGMSGESRGTERETSRGSTVEQTEIHAGCQACQASCASWASSNWKKNGETVTEETRNTQRSNVGCATRLGLNGLNPDPGETKVFPHNETETRFQFPLASVVNHTVQHSSTSLWHESLSSSEITNIVPK